MDRSIGYRTTLAIAWSIMHDLPRNPCLNLPLLRKVVAPKYYDGSPHTIIHGSSTLRLLSGSAAVALFSRVQRVTAAHKEIEVLHALSCLVKCDKLR